MKTIGHVSRMFPKQQFSVTLPMEMSILGMAPARRWGLAMSFVDTSFQRDPLGFDIYRALGGWATETRYVNLMWQGVDFGLYYFVEWVERAPGRLQIPQADASHPAASGYLVTVDWPSNETVSVRAPTTSTYFSFLYPKSPTPGQVRFAQGLADRVDDYAASSGLPSDRGLEQAIDFRSFARYFVTEELAKDVDGYAFSDFVAIHEGKMFSAAPWDFDLAFGFACMPLYFRNGLTGANTAYSVAGWNVENVRDNAAWIGPYGFPGGSIKEFGSNRRQLFTNIWRHPNFRAEFARTWKAARRGPLADAALAAIVERRRREIAAAAERDIGLWRGAQRNAFFDACHPGDSQNFTSATRHLLDFLLQRARWIDDHVPALVPQAAT